MFRDNSAECPVGLVAHLPLSPGHLTPTLGPAAPGFRDGSPRALALQPLLCTAHGSALTQALWGSGL